MTPHFCGVLLTYIKNFYDKAVVNFNIRWYNVKEKCINV